MLTMQDEEKNDIKHRANVTSSKQGRLVSTRAMLVRHTIPGSMRTSCAPTDREKECRFTP